MILWVSLFWKTLREGGRFLCLFIFRKLGVFYFWDEGSLFLVCVEGTCLVYLLYGDIVLGIWNKEASKLVE